jgi:hypothetical protein
MDSLISLIKVETCTYSPLINGQFIFIKAETYTYIYPSVTDNLISLRKGENCTYLPLIYEQFNAIK